MSHEKNLSGGEHLPDGAIRPGEAAIDAALHEAQEAAEKATRKAEELAQLSLYDPSPLIRFDVDHNKLLYVNPATFNRYSDIFRRGVEHPLLAEITEFALRAISQRRTVTREVSIGAITYQQSITPNLLGGERIVTIYNHDITKLKQTEAVLREERERAEAANRAKSDFLANVSHELRTPMNGVLGVAGLLKEIAPGGEQLELIETIIQSGESLMLLLNDILDLSKIEAHELNFEQTPFNLLTLMQETVRLFDTLTVKKHLDLQFHYNKIAPECFVGDAARLRQIVSNLLSNAVKFTEAGTVRLDISSCRRADGRVDMIFRVDDTGIGIDEKNIGKIFDKFTQADNSTTRKYGGTGLGLTICKLLAEAMDGKIGVESRLGKGSSFWFTVPLLLADAQQAARLGRESERDTDNAPEPAMDVSGYRVLVVDDHPVNLFFARKLLARMGFRKIETVEDGKAALALCARDPFDLIILDCQMPGMDGYDVSRELRAREEGSGRRTPIVAMTANAMIGDREKCFEAGMDDYVSKPITAPRMKEVLLKWLGNPALPRASAAEALPASASPQAGAPPVDMDHLREYIGDDAGERQIVTALFLSGVEESLAVMQAAAARPDPAAWRKAAHKLKGSAANLGANPLRDLCARAEDNADAPDDAKNLLVRDIARACEEVRAFMSA